MDIIKKRIEAIRERADRATEGPWDMVKISAGVYDVGNDDACLRPLATCEDYPPYLVGGYNAEFIAAARTDIPDLLAMLEVALEGLEVLGKWGYDKDVTPFTEETLESIAAIAEGEGTE